MTPSIRSSLAYCHIEERPIFLDVQRDRYFMLQGALERAFEAFLAGGEISEEQIDRLIRARVLAISARSDAGRRPPDIITPRRSVLEAAPDRRRIGFAVIAGAGFCLARARARLRRDGFAHSIARIGARKRNVAAASETNGGAIERFAAAFNAARSLFPSAPNCLPDSLALLDFLHYRGVIADLLIGVRMDPFGAHCWVQTEDVLLNEVADFATAFTPILVA